MTAIHYIGFDVHKKTTSFCVKTAAGEIVEEGVVASRRGTLRNGPIAGKDQGPALRSGPAIRQWRDYCCVVAFG